MVVGARERSAQTLSVGRRRRIGICIRRKEPSTVNPAIKDIAKTRRMVVAASLLTSVCSMFDRAQPRDDGEPTSSSGTVSASIKSVKSVNASRQSKHEGLLMSDPKTLIPTQLKPKDSGTGRTKKLTSEASMRSPRSMDSRTIRLSMSYGQSCYSFNNLLSFLSK